MPDASVPSRFLEEVPPQLLEDVSRPGHRKAVIHSDGDYASVHYNYEDEDQSASSSHDHGEQRQAPPPRKTSGYTGPKYNSIENIAEFFASRGKKFPMPKPAAETSKATKGATNFRPGQRVRHPKYGEGVVYQREGEGESAKITVQFPRFGLKKLMEKYAQLERA
jgi:DNA helicase II / ATP-dependent DNA helicase PcrA